MTLAEGGGNENKIKKDIKQLIFYYGWVGFLQLYIFSFFISF